MSIRRKIIERISRQEKQPRENNVIRGNNVSAPEEAADDAYEQEAVIEGEAAPEVLPHAACQ